VKLTYNKGSAYRLLLSCAFIPFFVARGAAADVLLRKKSPLSRYRQYHKSRGMSLVHDWQDWLGGVPFEMGKPDEIIRFYETRGFALFGAHTCGGGSGNNEYVFSRIADRGTRMLALEAANF